jgi:hypothetical protein
VGNRNGCLELFAKSSAVWRPFGSEAKHWLRTLLHGVWNRLVSRQRGNGFLVRQIRQQPYCFFNGFTAMRAAGIFLGKQRVKARAVTCTAGGITSPIFLLISCLLSCRPCETRDSLSCRDRSHFSSRRLIPYSRKLNCLIDATPAFRS